MKLVLRLLIAILPLAGVGMGASWLLLHLAVGFFPQSPQPVTHHTIPYYSHGKTYYFNSFQHALHTWGLWASIGLMLLYWLVLFIWKETYGQHKA
jgi:hypothetical protein